MGLCTGQCSNPDESLFLLTRDLGAFASIVEDIWSLESLGAKMLADNKLIVTGAENRAIEKGSASVIDS